MPAGYAKLVSPYSSIYSSVRALANLPVDFGLPGEQSSQKMCYFLP